MGMEADAELSQIQIYALSGKIQGTNKLIATIEGLHDTSALDDANDTIDHLNDQLAYWGGVVADQKVELMVSKLLMQLTSDVTLHLLQLNSTLKSSGLEVMVADLEAIGLTAMTVNVELKGELFTAQQNVETWAGEATTATDLANSNYDSLVDSVKTLEADVAAAEGALADTADVIEGFNPRDAKKFRADPADFIGKLYNYILSIQ